MKDVHLSEATQGKLLIVLLCTWVQVKVNLCSHYFFSKKDAGTIISMALLLGYGGKTQTIFCYCYDVEANLNFLLALLRYRGKPKPSFVVCRIQRKTQTIFCHCQDMGGGPKLYSAITRIWGEQTYEWDREDRGKKMEGDEDTKWIKVQKNGSEDAVFTQRGK
jgi:hypothetical protein